MRRFYTIMAMLFVSCAGCGEMVPVERAVATMEAAGYKNVRVTDQHGVAPQWAGCSEGDAVAFDVSATNPAGKQTTATVCCGLMLKGCTIRH